MEPKVLVGARLAATRRPELLDGAQVGSKTLPPKYDLTLFLPTPSAAITQGYY
jgi:hypothetical protein